MTAKSVDILGGPSKCDLMFAMFDREQSRTVKFVVQDWISDNMRTDIDMHVQSIKQEEGSCEAWTFKGRITDGPDEVIKYWVTGSYDTKARKGKLEFLGDGNPPEKEVIDCHGMIIHKAWGRIVAVENNSGGDKISIGDMVVSNGRFGATEGEKGIVVDILEPYTKGTTDVIRVWFEGHTCDCSLKFRDLKR